MNSKKNNKEFSTKKAAKYMPAFKPLPASSKDKLKQVVLQMDKDEDGHSIITDRYLKELCEENGQFSTPALNDTLYLHYKGF
jgi:hypothetical protein